MTKHFWIVPGLVVWLAASTALAALTPDQQKCQKQVGLRGATLLKQVVKTLEKCRAKVSSGKLPPATDCSVEPATATKIAGYGASLTKKITKVCPDMVVASLPFGGQCAGSTSAAGLSSCLVQAHGDEASALVDSAYATTGVLSTVQRKCQSTAGKSALTFVNTQHKLLRKCKDNISNGSVPPSTDCAAQNAAALLKAHIKAATKITSKCPASAMTGLPFGSPCAADRTGAKLAACLLRTHRDRDDTLIVVEYGTGAKGTLAVATAVTSPTECIGGPLARCRVGDYLLTNDKIRVVIQGIQRNLFGIGQFGGQIIDADLVRLPLDPDRDNFEEWSTLINLENTAHYTTITVLNDGSDGLPAIVRVTGVDDLLDFLNPSSTVAGLGFVFPPAADDTDLPIEILTDYILKPGTNYVRVETTIQNISATQFSIFFGDVLNGSGQVAEFLPAYGFGEPLVTARCPAAAPNPCNAVVYAGHNNAAGVSYGYINEDTRSSTFTTSGVSVPLVGTEVLFALLGTIPPPYLLKPMGNPGDSITFVRHFIVGNGTVSSVLDTRNELQIPSTGRLEGNVTAGGNPAQRAQVAVLGDFDDGAGIDPLPSLAKNVVDHTLTDSNGNYALTLPPGNYEVMVNLEGYPYEGGGVNPVQHAITITAYGTTALNMALPATGELQVNAIDGSSAPIAAKVSVVGFDPSPDPKNTQTIFGLINNVTGIFNDLQSDGVPFGLTQAHFAGPSGSIGPVPLEPGSYHVVVSHGPEYSAAASAITVNAGSTSTVNAQVARVTDSTGYIGSDFHVHSIDSPDSNISRQDRVVSMLAEGVDYFTPSDHDFRSDFLPTVAALGAGALIKTATSAEITTFDYGHFNAWPVPIDPSKVNGGGVDHSGAAPDGEDFPSFGNYSLTPGQIVAAAKAGGATTVQINHVHSYFGLSGGSGLAIDTGLTPPQSAVPGAARRLDPGVANYFPADPNRPDAFEIWIGDDRGQILNNFLGRNMGDWFNMLNQGILKTGIADSDTHRRIITQAGTPRSMVASTTDAPGAIVPADASVNVNAGRVFGTNAPIVRVTTHADSTAEDGGLGIGQAQTISTTDGEVDIEVDIQSPIWAEFDRVEYYVNSTTTKTTALKESGGGQVVVTTYAITPDYVQNNGAEFTVNTIVDDPMIVGAQHLEATTNLHLSGLTEDVWIVVLVRGTDGISKPLFPVVPNSLLAKACSDDHCKSCQTDANCGMGNFCNVSNQTLAELTDGNLDQCGVNALAFTNPVYVDVNGGGWSAPGVQVNP